MTFTFALALLSCLQGAPATDRATDRAADLPARQDQTYVSRRPTADARLFHSEAVEKEIKRVLKVLKHPYLAWMFENCYPNTIDTTVHFFGDEGSGDDDTYVITGDINAMWLRDSSAQVYPYLQLAKKDKRLQRMLRGVIRRQVKPRRSRSKHHVSIVEIQHGQRTLRAALRLIDLKTDLAPQLRTGEAVPCDHGRILSAWQFELFAPL